MCGAVEVINSIFFLHSSRLNSVFYFIDGVGIVNDDGGGGGGGGGGVW